MFIQRTIYNYSQHTQHAHLPAILERYHKDGFYKKDVEVVCNQAEAYKTSARWGLVSEGYRIVASIGDQTSDLVGGYADKTFQLPNPFYTVI